MTALNLPLYADDGAPDSIAIDLVRGADLDRLSDAERAWADVHAFKAKPGSVLVLPDADGRPSRALAGIGEDDADPWTFAKIAAALPAGRYRFTAALPAAAAEAAVLGWALQHYRFDRYVSETAPAPRLLAWPQGVDEAALQRLIAAHYLVRDLVNTPASDMGPAELAAAVRAVADRHDASLTEIVGEDLLRHHLPAIYAVGKGSPRLPRLLDLEWGDPDAPRVTLVGKGVCFDSGGLDIKTGSSMRLMKKDMGGAAHALALADLVMGADLPVRLRLLIPAVENSVDGNAFRPGDVLNTYKGLTVEIDNTDAEGRLILADALALGDADAPDLMLDFATLTGAARVALGPDLPPFFTDDDALAAALMDAAQKVHDPLWRLPLWTPYEDDLKSTIADVVNSSSSGFAGAITAALFLRRFITAGRRWVHFDIYAWNKSGRPGRPTGGEAMGLRAAFQLLRQRYAKA